jgi:hypothetical protein
MAKVSSWAFKIWQRSPLSKFPAIRLVMARATRCKDGEDVCGWSMAMIDLVIISAVLGEDVEQ